MPLTAEEELELLQLEEEEYQSSLTGKQRVATPSDIMSGFPAAISETTRPLREFGRDVLSGFTLGAYGKQTPQEELMAGSFMAPPRIPRKIGQTIGAIAPIVASEMTGGAALAGLAGARGAGLFGRAVASGAGTGLTYGAAESAVSGATPIEGAKKSAEQGVLFAGFGAAGQGMGYLRKVFGEKLSDFLANHFVNTQQKLAEKLLEQGKPNLGNQFLKTELAGFKNREEVYNGAGKELRIVENRIKGRLELNLENLKKPQVTATPPISGTPLLEHKPATITPQAEAGVPPPWPGMVDKSGARPAGQGGIAPRRGNIEEPDLTVLPTKEFETAQTGYTGGFGGGKFAPQTPAEIASESAKHREATRFAADKYGLKDLPSHKLSITRGEAIDINDIASAVDPVISGMKTGTRRRDVRKIANLKKEFIEDNPRQMSLWEAMGLKRKLDDRVSRAYLAPQDAAVSTQIQIEEALANKLRQRIYEIDPKIGEYAAQESLMIRIRTGLSKEVAKSGQDIRGLYHVINDGLFGTAFSNVAAKGLKETMGTPSRFLAPATRQATRSIGLTPFENTRQLDSGQ